MLTYIVLLGPPGAGKGTQSKVMANELNLPHISTGDIFRENIKNGTPLGRLADTFISKGQLVPDDVTIAMLRERFTQSDCKNGTILDGFPRTPTQADELEILLNSLGGRVNLVLFITAPVESLIERLAGRWTCKAGGHIFHESFNPPKKKGVCDIDGSELFQRDDDKAETVLNRIEIYKKQTSPLIQYYTERGLLVEINGFESIEKVSAQVMAAVQEAKNSQP
ncbi:MAG: adenylate kinase [Anaerolineales bacterium]|nr:adenylate kinase [Anaerolineales bacterium]